MINQLQMTTDGRVLDKVEIAIKRLQAFEPPEGYYVAFSGGKDSQCVYHLCKMAGVKFDAHYNVTSVDPPELVRFIKNNYPDVRFERQYSPDGKPITMWSLIEKEKYPPTRIARYCCKYLKESSGEGRITVTGVRWAESSNRKTNQGAVTITDPSKKEKYEMELAGVNFTKTNRGGVVLNDDNDASRRTVEHCYRTSKTMVNPIVDWDDDDVWEFLGSNNIQHCCLYDEGMTRLGCIGCPMGRYEKRRVQFLRWPKYKVLYLRSFDRMLMARQERGLGMIWQTADEVMEWWMEG